VPPQPVQPLGRPRVEPKTFFANERTFLQVGAGTGAKSVPGMGPATERETRVVIDAGVSAPSSPWCAPLVGDP
jgi:hypothetical protein